MQEMPVWSLIQEDPMCHRATEPVHHNYWAYAGEPGNRNCWAHSRSYWSLKARARQQEKPPQWEVHALQRRVAPLTTTEKSLHSIEDPAQPNRNKYFFKLLQIWPIGSLLALVPFWNETNFFSLLCFLTPQNAPGSSCIFLASALEWTTFLRNSDFSHWRMASEH